MRKVLLFVFSVIILDAMGPCGGSRHYSGPYLDVSKNVIELGCQQGASGEFEVKSNLKWTITTQNVSWLEISPRSGEDNAKITVISKFANETPYSRDAYIIIAGDSWTQQVQVYQMGKTPDDK